MRLYKRTLFTLCILAIAATVAASWCCCHQQAQTRRPRRARLAIDLPVLHEKTKPGFACWATAISMALKTMNVPAEQCDVASAYYDRKYACCDPQTISEHPGVCVEPASKDDANAILERFNMRATMGDILTSAEIRDSLVNASPILLTYKTPLCEEKDKVTYAHRGTEEKNCLGHMMILHGMLETATISVYHVTDPWDGKPRWLTYTQLTHGSTTSPSRWQWESSLFDIREKEW